jgi:hypothetical protein
MGRFDQKPGMTVRRDCAGLAAGCTRPHFVERRSVTGFRFRAWRHSADHDSAALNKAPVKATRNHSLLTTTSDFRCFRDDT